MITQSEVQEISKQLLVGDLNIEKLFELAIETANLGYPLKAMAIAREALIFAKQQNKYIAIYIHSFLAVLSMDFLKFSSARIHLYNALNRLDKNHFSYNTDQQYLGALLQQIENLEQNSSSENRSSLAA
ncbi:MAG: hypothetical protein R2772_07070 [Chitinophagales bacterium]